MKNTKKILQNIIKEELEELVEQGWEPEPEPGTVHPVVEALKEALGARQSRLLRQLGVRNIEVISEDQYRGGGTAYVVRFDTNIGAMKLKKPKLQEQLGPEITMSDDPVLDDWPTAREHLRQWGEALRTLAEREQELRERIQAVEEFIRGKAGTDQTQE
tara:strand:+ start:7060 stop:7536 length:477 start_codon:yes stop_codon:yes gene_type:complete